MTSIAMAGGAVRASIDVKERYWRLTLLAVVLWAAWMARDLGWAVVWESAPFLLKGLAISWVLALTSIGLGALAAVPLAVARVYGPVGLRHAAVAVIEVVRATPELMIVFWIFFAFPALIGQAVSNWTAAVAALSVIAAAYLAEVIRGGLYSVPKEQWDAALSAGLSRGQAFVYVVLPQALRNMVPALVAQLVSLFKTTSLVYVIGVIEFFRAVTIVNNSAFAPYALYLTMAVGYFLCCWLLTWVVHRFDPKYLLVE
ncbi:amino acid ABC transporter permease [Pelagibius litoralis]|uniref:Amino acid ABC transporter permease n=1 Tax=Pelagibius litoralis TaxID=374515 RepID=A0A967EZP7_9PROT|nr:amino acid ABC transporter permease [Pelagibius litoralis]NIA70443.1 amino acid ABC transporter permease [Pelagibius litoralis]